MKNNYYFNKINAFTLVELIIVITIFAILSVIWFLTYKSIITTAKDTKKVNDIKTISNQLRLISIKNNLLPEPESSNKIFFWSSNIDLWIVWDNLSYSIWLKESLLDSEMLKNYTYSKYWINNYEISTIIDNSSRLGYSFINKAYSNYYNKVAFIEWNYNWYFVKYNSWSNINFLSLPSITLTDKDIIIQDWLTTTGVVIRGLNNLPYSYNGSIDTNFYNNFEYTPYLLYSWLDCPTNYEDIIEFVDNLQLSYQSIRNWQYDYIKSLYYDSDKVILWVRLLKESWCKIDIPEIPDIYPRKCWWKDLNFERYATWSIIWQDCLFQLTWSWLNINTINNIPKTWNKALRIWLTWWSQKSYLKYSFNLKTHAKIKFYYFTPHIANSQTNHYIDFNINWINYKRINTSVWVYTPWESQLLYPWTYDFVWELSTWITWHDTIMQLDDIHFTCIWWWEWCWWDYDFEYWNIYPESIFSYSWTYNKPWLIDDLNKSSWLFSIKAPKLSEFSSSILEFKFNTTESSKLLFDHKYDIGYSVMHRWKVRIYIDWILKFTYSSNDVITDFITYKTDLLLPWDHTFKIIVDYWNWRLNYNLDNIRFWCINWEWDWC